ncbi:DUF2269 family protein [Paenibacillus ihumii]|uniref:DUF2269 family protein n=1 Tax=Paenibacillus ihumii TaxID=687436 RepID=UPI0006D80CEC|nr:DUF2269 family protein [Paenibacillus ihumii]
MDKLRIILLYIHILSAITTIGPFFVLISLVPRLRSAGPEARQAYLNTFKSAIRLVKHMGHVLVVSGILLILAASWSWLEPWLVATYIILACSLYFMACAFTPKLRKFGEPDVNEEALIRKLIRSVWIYLLLLLVMLWLMVAKPQLW